MKGILAIAVAMLVVCGYAQPISYFNQGFLRQPNSKMDRDYLGIYGSNIFNWGTNAPWDPPLNSYVKKSGDIMTGPLIVESLSGIVVSNNPANPTSLITSHGMLMIGQNDASHIVNDDNGGVSIYTVGAGPYPVGPAAVAIDLNGTMGVAGGVIAIGGTIAGNGGGLTNIPASGVVGVGILASNNVWTGTSNVFNLVTATNFITSAVKWVDVPMNYSSTTLGADAPGLTAVTNNSVILGLGFDNNDKMYAQGQFPHTVAITNAAFPNFYFEPHVHFTTIGTLDSTHSNVTWRAEWQIAAINGTWFNGTNSVTIGITNNHVHYMAELGHITNNALGISSVFRCRLMRPSSASQEYDSTPNSHTVIMDAFDLHVPIGNTNAIGSSSDNAP